MLTPTNQPVQAIVLPEPRVSIDIRPAVPRASDLKFIDDLQKMHTRMVGWMPTAQLEAHIAGVQQAFADTTLSELVAEMEANDRRCQFPAPVERDTE